MTALLLDSAPVVSHVRLAAPAARRTPSGRARACAEVGRQRRHLVTVAPEVAAPTTQLAWTTRGLVVVLSLIALVVGLMATTLVVAFLSVSDAPLPASAPAAAQMQVSPGR